jgi:hypothetical protein
MTCYSFSLEDFDSAIGYACHILASADPSQTEESQCCVQKICEHYAYTLSAVPAGLSVKLALLLPPNHRLCQLLFFITVHALHILLLSLVLAMDEFHCSELLSYSPSHGTYNVILANQDNSLGYWDFVERT